MSHGKERDRYDTNKVIIMKRESQKLLILRGIQGSGKSTFAKEKCNKDSNYKRVNRDDFRNMLDSYSLNHDLEKTISYLEDMTVETLLKKRYSVVWDNTHIRPSYLSRALELVKKLNAGRPDDEKITPEIVDFSDVPLDVCLERNAKRERPVPEDVVRDFAKRLRDTKTDFYKVYADFFSNAGKVKEQIKWIDGLPTAVIFDIDGTIAHMNGKRGPYEEDKVILDDVDHVVKDLVLLHKEKNRTIIFCSGRTDSCRDMTIKWLNREGIPFDFLFMRKTGDQRKDSIVKREIFDNLIRDKFNIFCVVDDRDQVVEVWRTDLGLKTFQCNYGNF